MEYRNTVCFKDIEYLVCIKALNDILTLTLTNPKTSTTWTGSYTAKQIEDLTGKTGNTKSFAVFCKLLTAALQSKNPSLHLDFYSYQDLESLRKGSSKLSNSSKPSKKKYLIISYITDFEKVHYPLPVILQDLQNKDYEVSKPSDSEVARLKQENAALLKSLNMLKEEFFSYRERTESKIDELTGIKQDLECEIQRMKEELDMIIMQLEDEAKKRNKDGGGEVKSLKANLARQVEENMYLKGELARSKVLIEELKNEEVTNRRMFEALNRKIDYDEEDEHIVPIGSPQQTSFRFGSGSSRIEEERSSHLSDLHSQISRVQHLIQKNKS